VALLCAMSLLKVFSEKDMAALGLRVFPKYLEVARKLQRVYALEPAGSHGVWGLDDHQFLPYLWGASQLCGKPSMDPGSRG
jgi:serine/threonine-protein phosphatase 2A activator